MKFGKLILRKIIKIVATRCHILKLKCTKFNFCWGGLLPWPRWGSLQRYPDLVDSRGPTSKEREGGIQRRGERGRKWGSPTHYFRLKSCSGNVITSAVSPSVQKCKVIAPLPAYYSRVGFQFSFLWPRFFLTFWDQTAKPIFTCFDSQDVNPTLLCSWRHQPAKFPFPHFCHKNVLNGRE